MNETELERLVIRLTGDADQYFNTLNQVQNKTRDQVGKTDGTIKGLVGSFGGINQALLSTSSLSGQVGKTIAGPFNTASQAGGGFLSVLGGIGGSLVSMGVQVLSATGILGLLTTVFGFLAAGVSAVIGLLGFLVIPLVAVAAPILALVGVVAALAVGFAVFAAAGAGVLGILSHLGSEGAQSIMQLRRMSFELGVTTEQAAALSVYGEHMTHALFHMQHSVAALTGATHGAAGALEKLGIDTEAFSMANANTQLRMIAGSFQNLTSQTERAMVVRALFGRGGVEMMDMLSRGTAGLDEQARRAQRFGLDITRAEADMVRNSLLAWKQWGDAWEGIKRQLAIAFAPVWEMLGNVGGDIGEKVVGWVKEAVPFFWSLWDVLSNIGSTLRQLGSNFADFLLDQLGLGEASFADFQAAAARALDYVNWGLNNLGPIFNYLGGQADIMWQRIKLAGLQALDAIVGFLRGELTNSLNSLLPNWMNNLRNLMSPQFFESFVNAIMPGMGTALSAGATALNAGGPTAPSPLASEIDGLANSIAILAMNLEEEGSMLAAQAGAFADQAAATRELTLRALRAPSPESAGGTTTSPKQRTVSGTEATLAGSERAFTILFSNQATQEQLMRSQVEALFSADRRLASIDNLLATAPVVRAAS